MPEKPVDEGFVPEITWNDNLIWRSDLRSDRDSAYAAARCFADRLTPAVNADEQPTLVLAVEEGEFAFHLEYSVFEYRSEFMTPLQRACQVIAEIVCAGAPVIAWEPIIRSGGRVIWKPRNRRPWENVELAQQQAEELLLDRLRPAAYKHWEGEKWEPCIDYVIGSGSTEFRCLESDHWGTKTEAWRHAARVLADAEAGVQEVKDRGPLVTLPDSLVGMWDAA